MEKFGKEYKLCSRKKIQLLFSQGLQTRSFPFTIYRTIEKKEHSVPFQIVISVPKRIWKKAHDRNAIKRLLKESIRKNKQEFENFLTNKGIRINLCIIYTHSEKFSFIEVEKYINKAFKKIEASLMEG